MPGQEHRFDRDIAVALRDRAETGAAFDARIDEGWWIVAGPNGGYLAAILLRAMCETVGDPAREPRTQTTHYTARPEAGPARVVTEIVRAGRSLSTVSARLEQDGRLIATSIAALGTARAGERPAFQDARPPELPPPDAVPLRPPDPSGVFPFRDRYEMKPAFDHEEPNPSGPAVTGGWIRLAGPRQGDALLLTALADAWPPAVFQKLGRWSGGRGVPTVELTTHFRAPSVAAGLSDDAWYGLRFETRSARDGFIDETGEIYSEDGVLLAESRQLALLA